MSSHHYVLPITHWCEICHHYHTNDAEIPKKVSHFRQCHMYLFEMCFDCWPIKQYMEDELTELKIETEDNLHIWLFILASIHYLWLCPQLCAIYSNGYL